MIVLCAVNYIPEVMLSSSICANSVELSKSSKSESSVMASSERVQLDNASIQDVGRL